MGFLVDLVGRDLGAIGVVAALSASWPRYRRVTADVVVDGVANEPLDLDVAHEGAGLPARGIHFDQHDHQALAGHGWDIGWTGRRLRGGVNRWL